MNRSVFFLLVVVLSISIFGADSEKSNVAKQGLGGIDSTMRVFYNPFLVGGASLVVPGAGQMYTNHYFKGGMFLAFEVITASTAIYWLNDAELTKSATKALRLKVELDTGISRIRGTNDAELSAYDEHYSRYRGYNTLAWASGLYVYNVLDAIQCSNIIDKSGARNPFAAGLLSAVPGLALGQWYNGSLSKAGMIFMGQMSMGVVALNYHRLMNDAGNKYLKTKTDYNLHILNASALGRDTLALSASRGRYMDSWESKRSSAFKYRNTYLWYSIFFYVYGICDAVIDAHLHDFPEKMRMYPDLVPQSDGALLNLNVKF